MLARLGEFPVGVFSADWTLLSWTPAWAVLMGDPNARTHVERNLVRAVFSAGPSGLAAWLVLQDGVEVPGSCVQPVSVVGQCAACCC
ncbi:hypothetical protein [Streptomyces sp. TLI_185]|uniref:MmyB family transcriptional regulator n=1 Tax=Streptomyces sp. TLI_185 TaxID=2485151 RepID=UPI0037DA18AC